LLLDGHMWPEVSRQASGSSHPVNAQVFDGEGGVVMGKGEGVAAPLGCWGGLCLACVNERDRERAWSQTQGRVQIDMAGTGWGWLGGVGARGWKQARLGTQRDAGVSLRMLIWSEGQREGVVMVSSIDLP
jgi:hypothetical protein